MLFRLNKLGLQGLANTEFEHFFILILSLLFDFVLVFVGFDKLLILLFIVVLDVFSYVIVHLDVIFEPSVSLSFKHLLNLVCISFLFEYLKAIFELFIKLRRCDKLLDLILDVFFDPFARWQQTSVFFGSYVASGNFCLLAFGLSFLLVYLVLPRKDYF